MKPKLLFWLDYLEIGQESRSKEGEWIQHLHTQHYQHVGFIYFNGFILFL